MVVSIESAMCGTLCLPFLKADFSSVFHLISFFFVTEKHDSLNFKAFFFTLDQFKI